MSNNIYDILNKFNAVEEKGHEPVQQQPKAKSRLAENMETVEGQLNEKYMGFKKTVAAVKKGGSADNPEAVAAAIGRKKYGKEKFQKAAAAGKKLGEEQGVAEVAPPGAKAERMVKHIKKGYAKDGKLTDREKGIAYATAWKAHKAGKVEEAVAALSILSRNGMTAEQISEGWEDMMKAVKQQHDTEKGTGKFDKKKDPTTGGTVYTRKYNPKSGETDDTENVTAVKRGRGRPKKSAFESYLNKFADLIEAKDELGDFIKGLDNKGASARTAPTPSTSSTTEKPQTSTGKTQTLGTIKGGVWTADPPKPGEKGVPVPVPVDEQSSVTGTAPTSSYAKGIEAELNKKPTSSARPAPATKPATSAQPASQYNAMGDYQGINMSSLNDVPKKTTGTAATDGPFSPMTAQQAAAARQKPARVAGPDQNSAETARLQRYQSGAAARQKPVADQPAQEPSPYNAMGDYQGINMGTLGSTPPKYNFPNVAGAGRGKVNPPLVKPPASSPVKPAAVAKPPSGPAQSAIEIGGEEEARLAMQQQAEKERIAQRQDDEAQANAGIQQGQSSARPEPVKPQRTWKDSQGQDWKDSSGNPVLQRSDNQIWWDNNYPNKPFPGEAEAQKAYDDRMSQGQKNLDSIKNFLGIGRGEKPVEKPLELTPKGDDRSFKPDLSQTVAEGIMTNELEEMMRLAGMEDVLKGKQHKLDKNKNGKLDATDFAMLRGEMDEDFAVKVPSPAQAGSAEQAKAIGAAVPAEPGKPDPFAKGEIVKPLKPMSFNPETGEIKANDMVFQPADKSMDEGTEMCRECGYTMTECGCDSAMPEQEEGHMNVSMNVDSDGHQSVTVSADGEDAAKLAQLLKLAGLGSGSAEAVYQPVEVVVGDEEEIEEEKDERYHASTTPDVEVFGTDVQLKGGNGDVAGQEKKMRKHGYQFGDNPLAMKETVARDYESIKVRK